MAAPNLLNATSIYGKNVTGTGTGSNQTLLTCPTDKLIKITGISVHCDGTGGGSIWIAGKKVSGGANMPDNGNYTLGSFYLTEAQTVVFNGTATDTDVQIDCVISYEEIDDA